MSAFSDHWRTFRFNDYLTLNAGMTLDGRIGPIQIDDDGYLAVKTVVPIVTRTFLHKPINFTATGAGGSMLIVPAVPGKIIYIYSVCISTLATVSVNFRSGTTDLEGPMPFATRAGYADSVDPPAHLMQSLVGDSISVVLTGNGSVFGRLSYWVDIES